MRGNIPGPPRSFVQPKAARGPGNEASLHSLVQEYMMTSSSMTMLSPCTLALLQCDRYILSSCRYKYILAYLPVVAFYYQGKVMFRFRLSASYEELRDTVANMTGGVHVACIVSDTT